MNANKVIIRKATTVVAGVLVACSAAMSLTGCSTNDTTTKSCVVDKMLMTQSKNGPAFDHVTILSSNCGRLVENTTSTDVVTTLDAKLAKVKEGKTYTFTVYKQNGPATIFTDVTA